MVSASGKPDIEKASRISRLYERLAVILDALSPARRKQFDTHLLESTHAEEGYDERSIEAGS